MDDTTETTHTPAPTRRRRRSRSITASRSHSVVQVGDSSLWNKGNAHTANNLVHTPDLMVLPGDFIYAHDASRQFKFYLYQQAQTEASEGEYNMLTRKGYFKVTPDDFESPRFEAKDGVFRSGLRGIWMAQPEDRRIEEKAKMNSMARLHFEGIAHSLESEGARIGVDAAGMQVAHETRRSRKSTN